jgi:threonine dehydrogenase-like Zn-dependent dehydrogenase
MIAPPRAEQDPRRRCVTERGGGYVPERGDRGRGRVFLKAVVWKAVREVSVQDVADAELEASTDVLMRVMSSAVCGTDLHIYEGRMGEPAGMVIGHEPVGVVEEVGSAVASVRPGDRVVVPTHICCGFCASCVSGRSAECLMTHPGEAGAAYGYPGMGDYRGAQAELVRVPFGDANCLRLPGEPGDDWEHDFVLLADAFPTGYHATELAGVSAGDSVGDLRRWGGRATRRPMLPPAGRRRRLRRRLCRRPAGQGRRNGL